jgi:hypothetical protein
MNETTKWNDKKVERLADLLSGVESTIDELKKMGLKFSEKFDGSDMDEANILDCLTGAVDKIYNELEEGA